MLVRKECMREGYSVQMPAPVSNSKWFKLEGPSLKEPVGLLALEDP